MASMLSSTTSSSSAPYKKDVRRRAETPTRELLRRVQKRSSAGMAMGPPPLPPAAPFALLSDRLAKAKPDYTSGRPQKLSSATQSTRQSPPIPLERDQSFERRSSDEVKEELTDQIDSTRDELDSGDELLSQLATHSAEAETAVSKAREHTIPTNNRGGLTRAAAYKLEREFASQERILQGLQKDNEAKTVEVERLRRERKIMAEHFARQYGAEDWEAIVFGPSASLSSSLPAGSATYEGFRSDGKQASMSHESPSTLQTMRKVLDSMHLSSSPAQWYKGSSARLTATTSVHELPTNDASFYSADESFAVAANPGPVPSHTLPSPPDAQTDKSPDLARILATIETQRLLIKGFERSNALKLVECREQVSLAREKEELWATTLEETKER